MAFNEREYINQYKKEHYSKLSVDLTKEEKQEIKEICSKKNKTIKQFILDAIKREKECK